MYLIRNTLLRLEIWFLMLPAVDKSYISHMVITHAVFS